METPTLNMTPPTASSAAKWTGAAFVYWLVFMAVLTPGNLAGADHWSLGREALRLTFAGLLGASVTPLLLALSWRYPVEGAARFANLARQGAAVVLMGPALILVSCLVAAWLLEGRVWPAPGEVREELTSNGLLLVFCLSLLLAAIQVSRRLNPTPSAPDADPWLRRVAVRERGVVTLVDLNEVDWIETQGNYQALHGPGGVHLLRETSERLAERLDPARFVRIHRRAIVAVDRVKVIEPLANGDATVRLADGAELRLSRRHRETLKARLAAA